MPVQFQFRRGTAAEWTAANPVLAAGELGLETDSGKFKIGNGSSNWSVLAYSSGPAGPTGAAGPTGPAGANGAVWYNGTGTPAAATGANNDYYLDTVTGDVYKKTSGAWGAVGNIKGPQGIQGTQGEKGDTRRYWAARERRAARTARGAGASRWRHQCRRHDRSSDNKK